MNKKQQISCACLKSILHLKKILSNYLNLKKVSLILKPNIAKISSMQLKQEPKSSFGQSSKYLIEQNKKITSNVSEQEHKTQIADKRI
ncbi:unnamed protein product [Paramecium sonneborni]|uniref:Uncharacterized protein n=1 Tax=Paramecium sonneborni TaxID=65129 RepID=A0A8S1PTB6_9CILI|nr:unnamed protein product [Paramecium sonneborni]